MPRVVCRVAQPAGQLVRLVVGHRMKQRQGPLRILHGVERHDVAVLQPHGFATVVPLVQKFGVVLLNVRRVAQHPVAQIHRGGRGIDRPGESAFDQGGKIAAVVDVGVRKHHGVYGGARKRQIAILLVGFFAASLIHAAIQQEALPGSLDPVHRSGDLTGSTPECELQFSSGTVNSSRVARGWG